MSGPPGVSGESWNSQVFSVSVSYDACVCSVIGDVFLGFLC